MTDGSTAGDVFGFGGHDIFLLADHENIFFRRMLFIAGEKGILK